MLIDSLAGNIYEGKELPGNLDKIKALRSEEKPEIGQTMLQEAINVFQMCK